MRAVTTILLLISIFVFSIESSQLEFYFNQVDLDGDGRINFAEWRAAYEHVEEFQQPKKTHENEFEVFKKSTMGDEFITFDEFLEQFGRLETNNHTSPEQIHLSIRSSNSFFVIWVTKCKII